MDPSQPCPNGTCHFLRLSAELKNMVYGYTLTSPNGILCREGSYDCLGIFRFYAAPVIKRKPSINVRENKWYAAQLEKSLKTATEINQLKYVCRQLNHETKNLLLCANKLVFGYGPRDLLSFLEVLPKTLHDCLQEITIWEHRKLLASKFHHDRWWCTIDNICKKQDAFTIRMIWPSLVSRASMSWLGDRGDRDSITSRIALFTICARKDMTFVNKVSADRHWRDFLTRGVYRAQRRVSRQQAVIKRDLVLSDKIRIFPSHEKFPDHKSKLFFEMFWVRGQELKVCMASMKEIFEHGI
jgi:hypothetical protein